jgi:Mitochondrial ribosomal protein L27
MNALRCIHRVTTIVVPSQMSTCTRLSSKILSSVSFPSTLSGLQQFYYNQIQQRCMSKYVSKSMKKNLPLTTKRARKGFYKGKGCTKEGKLNSTGRFIVNPLKRLQLVVPNDLSTFRLKPYIASTASRFPPEERHNSIPA